jgi:hypothetical protein
MTEIRRGLEGEQLRVRAIGAHELLVRAALDDPAFGQHVDSVGRAHAREAV